MSSDNLKILLKTVFTREDWLRLRREIDRLEESLYKTGDGGYEMVLENKVRKELAEMLDDQKLSKDIINDQLREIREELGKVNAVKIILAVEPSRSLVKDIWAWVEKNVGEEIILEIKINPGIMGGLLISWNGRYADFSLRKKWEKDWVERGRERLKKWGMINYG
jgi:hypothetical protein